MNCVKKHGYPQCWGAVNTWHLDGANCGIGCYCQAEPDADRIARLEARVKGLTARLAIHEQKAPS